MSGVFRCLQLLISLYCPCFPPVLTHSLSFKRVPDVDVEVVIASQYQASRQGGCQGGHPAHDAGVLVGDELLVGSQVVQLTSSIIGPGYHCVTIGEELEEREGIRN